VNVLVLVDRHTAEFKTKPASYTHLRWLGIIVGMSIVLPRIYPISKKWIKPQNSNRK